MVLAYPKKSLCATLSVIAFIILFILVITPDQPVRESIKMTESILAPECQCDLYGDKYDFCYRLPTNPQTKGNRFDCEHAKYLEKLGILSEKDIVDLKTQEIPEPGFVTAMSANHYNEGLTLIANFRKLWPQRKLYVYDLGLGKNLLNELKEMCMVEVRQFNFTNYPSYVKTLAEYRWKPLIIAEMLNEFGAVWYMDTSVRWKKDKQNIVYNEVTCRRNGTWKLGINLYDNATSECKKSAYLLHSSSGHGVFPTTHPGVYEFIPTDLEMLKNKSENHDAGFVFAVKTIDAVQILKWYVLCALEKNCMAPKGAQLYCNFGKDRYKKYAHCHRYDQSVINLLLSNANGYNAKNYVSKLGDGAKIERSSEKNFTKNDFLCENRTEEVEGITEFYRLITRVPPLLQ